jgi:hypothetical protein
MGDPASIDLAPVRDERARGPLGALRRGARRLHTGLAAAIVVAVVVQVYLIGAYVFGAGTGALDAHRSVGFTTHGLELAVLLAALLARLGRTDLLLSLTLAVLGTVQIALASGHEWVGGLHPLLALVVLGLAGALVRRAIQARRTLDQHKEPS